MTNGNLATCKIQFFANYSSRAISCWLIVLACSDRFFHSSTSANIRRLSSMKVARWATAITTVLLMLLYSHMLIYYEISNVFDRFGSIVPMCNAQKGIYRTFIGFWYMSWYSLLPAMLMLLFGFLTLNNLRQHRQVIPRTIQGNQIVRRTDQQLLRMLIAQVLVINVSTLPYSIEQLYSAFTTNLSKSTLRIAQETFVSRTLGAMTAFAHTTSFYLFTLTGTVFRKELRKIIRSCCSRKPNFLNSTRPKMHRVANVPQYH
ncbi:unnamed protein product [Adineta ricciae]|uniref:G-protein coupled receptors family 1 profile domain-containing protein n=1 Tax=Adineta ricciae TaxID=249248 RepID=A0A815C553_ADIRI|nr:unnamed protein product [Adineta ricciae]